jgi:hypothetical protein
MRHEEGVGFVLVQRAVGFPADLHVLDDLAADGLVLAEREGLLLDDLVIGEGRRGNEQNMTTQNSREHGFSCGPHPLRASVLEV